MPAWSGRDFHEPVCADDLEDDLAALLAAEGLLVTAVEPHLGAKVVVARRPAQGAVLA